MSVKLFADDEVALKEDPSIIAFVEQTWQDADFTMLPPTDFLLYKGVDEAFLLACFTSRHLTKGLVVIRITQPAAGLTLCREEDLILRNRGLSVGDVVKQPGSFKESGYVVKTTLDCECRPIYPDLPHNGTEPWPHKAEDNEIRVASEDIELRGFVHGKIIIYKGWIGEVIDMTEDATVRMSDGSVVRIYNIDDLEFDPLQAVIPEKKSLTAHLTLAEAVRHVCQKWIDSPDASARKIPDLVYPGQLVYAKKSVFRLGNWVIGRYTPSIPPHGHVVDVHLTSMEVDWLTCDPFIADRSKSPPRPDTFLDAYELNDVAVYNRNNQTELAASGRNYGARQSQDIVVGDRVSFKDVAGAAVKYTNCGVNRNAGGGFRRIPRAITNGFDINTLIVIGTKQRCMVQWQNGTTTQEVSTDLFPDLNVDEHDYFVGELCSLRSAETRSAGLVTLKKVGVIQSVDARERLVRVRWYGIADVTLIEGDHTEMLAESVLRDLEQEVNDASVYEITTYPALVKRRGDLVVVRPLDKDRGDIIMDSITGAAQPAPSTSPTDIRWFGEVVDLGDDGLITVRLGALDKVEYIRVPVNKVYTVLGTEPEVIDGQVGSSFYDDHDYSTESEDDSMSDMEVIEETITYEGEPPADADDEDAWMTDEEDEHIMAIQKTSDSSGANPSIQPGSSADRVGTRSSPQAQADGEEMALDSDAPPTTSESQPADTDHADYAFSSFPNKPAQFAILDGSVPPDHHFASRNTPINGAILRRIRKEHSILSTSLPPGIFVRTWEGSLSAMRILILGPRNTPYELAPFVLDVHFSSSFPYSPPQVFFHSWTNGVGRVNPNLYEDGKICLSILGTWPHDQRNEGWNKDKSSLLQVLVSLMGLVLVENPYYNEAGFDSLIGTAETQFAAETYSQKSYCMSKGFLNHALLKPVTALDDVVQWLYVKEEGPQLLALTLSESQKVLESSRDGGESGTFHGAFSAKLKLSTGAQILLKRHLEPLEKRLAGSV